MGSAASSTSASNKASDSTTSIDHATPSIVDHEEGDGALLPTTTVATTSTTPSPNISSVAQNRQSFTTSSSLQSGFVMRCPSSPARLQAIPVPPQKQSTTVTPLTPDSPLAHSHFHTRTTPHSLQAIRTTSSTSSSRQASVGSTHSINNNNTSKKSKRFIQGEFKSVISEEDRQRAERVGRRQQSTSWGAAEVLFRTGSNRTRHGGNNNNSSVESGDGGDISPLLVSSSLPPLPPNSSDSGLGSISKPFQLLPPISTTSTSDKQHPQRVDVILKPHSSNSNNSSPILEGERSGEGERSSRVNEYSSTHTPPLSIRTKRQDSMLGGATTSSTIGGDLSWVHPTFIEPAEDSSISCSRVVGVGSSGGGEMEEENIENNNNNEDSAKVIHGMIFSPQSPLIPTPPTTSSPKNNNNNSSHKTATTTNNTNSFHPLPVSSPPTSPPLGNNNNISNSASSGGGGFGGGGKIPSIKRRTAKPPAATSTT